MSETADLERKKIQLVERLGVHLENEVQLPPLAARIYATLILTGKGGITFEQLVNYLNASKSTVCTHLQSLQTKEMVSYFTRPGDRKRYFTVAPNRLVRLIDEMTTNWNNQEEIQQEILAYKESANSVVPHDPQFDVSFHKEYLVFLTEASQSIKKLKQNIINTHFNNE